MEIKSFLIAGGNSTDLIWNCPSERRLEVAKKYLTKVEQVGFISKEKGFEKLTMMGDELCVDAMLALAYNGSSDGKFLAFRVDDPVIYKNDGETTIMFRLPYMRDGNAVLFDGIGYLCTDQESKISKDAAAQLAKQYNLPAFGIILYRDGRITPHVYVVKTDSFIDETGCGSGSIAVNIVTGWETITQPSGNNIKVHWDGDLFTVSAKVTRQQ